MGGRGSEVHGGSGQPPQDLEPYVSMVTASSSLMAFVDSTYRYRAVNQAYCDEHQRTQDEILGHSISEVIGGEVFERTLRPHFERCLQRGWVTHYGFWWDSPRQGRRHINGRYHPFFEADGSVSGIVVDERDTTEGAQMEDQLKASVRELEVANQELEAFSGAVAHDLRSPLLVVKNFSHQLHEALGTSLDGEHQDDVQRISFAGRHMMYIIDDLCDLSDVNRHEIYRAEIDLSKLAREIIDELRVLAPDREVTFEAEPGINAIGDARLVRILLTNLLQNAWKYSGPRDDARIELGVEDKRDVLTYHVRDNGIGFDNANRQLIFEAFERLHTRAEFAGSGLGLATVERIIRRHHGRVWADGVPGEGAVFRFHLGPPSRVPPGGQRRRVERDV